MKRTFIVTAILILASISYAGVDKSGIKPNVLSLPSGPGSVEGLGESFEPQLNSGTTTYAVKLKVPPGRAGFEPELTLRYNGGTGASPFGIGWSLSIPYIQRQTDKGLPEYNNTDTFIESSGEELVPIGNSSIYRHENEQAFIRYTRISEGWTAKTRSGMILKYGPGPETQIRIQDKVFQWLLEEMADPNGNKIHFQYSLLNDNPQRYCTSITYNNHEIIFAYESRPDALPDYRATFRLETAFRCKSVSMHTNGKLVRRYDLAYEQNTFLSLLKSVTQIGTDQTSHLPPATFTYTRFDPAKARVITIEPNENSIILANEPNGALNDMNADALPDLLIANPGTHQVYLNMGIGPDGKHHWGGLTQMGSASPGEALANPGVSLADINGDGKTDFIARRSQDTYFLWPNNGAGKWSSYETFADNSNLPFDFENPNVRLIDINNDKHIDVMYSDSPDNYSYFINNHGAEFTGYFAKTGLNMTFDQAEMKLADMNGDRLQDIVFLRDGICEYYPSMGFGNWDAAQKMANPPDSDKTPGIYNDWQKLMLTDLNGDGLTDIVYAPDYASHVMYWLNQDSTKFDGPFKVENTPVPLENTTVQPGDMNGNGTTDILWNYPEQADTDQKKLWQYLELCPDDKPYLLKTVTNGIGRTITFYYSTSTQEYIRDRENKPWPWGVPNPITVLSAFHVEDGGTNLYQTQFQYHNGYYDGKEKEFRGFAAAEKHETGDETIPGLIMAYTFDTGAEQESLKGKPLSLEARLNADMQTGDAVFYRESYVWTTRTLAQETNGDKRKVMFPFQQARTRDILEKGVGTPVQLKWEYEYDNYGNMTRQAEHGRTDPGWDDERVTETSYTAAYPSGQTEWILDKVVETSVFDENGTIAARMRNYYDENLGLGQVAKGNLTKVEQMATQGKYIVTALNKYDNYGNIIAAHDPLYGKEPGHWRELVYDDAFHTFPVQEIIHTGNDDAPKLTISAAYDYGFGVITSSTDFNGFTTNYGYDTFGRLTSITKPLDTDHTVEYDYVLAHNSGNGTIINWIETRQRDGSSGDGFLCSRSFFDGLGRKIMTRAEGENPGQIVVTDTVQFNIRMKPWKNYLPYFETGTLDYPQTSEVSKTSEVLSGFTEHFYDASGREIRVNQPAGPEGIAFSLVTYEPLARIVRDEEQTKTGSAHSGCGMRYVEDGLQDKDGKGRLRKVYEIVRLSDTGKPLAQPAEWLTSYTYDLLDNLTGMTDSQGNQKFMEYDMLGRKTFMNDPDRGHMNYTYDDANNLTRTVDAKNQVIEYGYDGVNRLTAEYFGQGKEKPDVEYHYDVPFGSLDQGDFWQSDPAQVISKAVLTDEYNPDFDLNSDGMVDVADVVRAAWSSGQKQAVTAENTRGFLSWVRDRSGEEHNSYDSRGRAEWVIKRITSGNDLKNFFTSMEYDSMDRITKLTYPDSTYATYTYNARGLLESVPHVIDQYDYNPSGQNAFLKLACGTVTNYEYDHRLRLDRLKTVRTTDSLVLQDLNYAYDSVSNITQIEDGRTNTALDAIGGELGIGFEDARKFNATQSFAYDSLYRLTQASNPSVYGLINYGYDRIGNMIQKYAVLSEPDPLMNLGKMTSGGNMGTWNRIGRNAGEAAGPHAVTWAEKGLDESMSFEYDDNGNMTSDRGMSLAWNYQDRLVGLTNGAKSAAYVYDYSGTRKRKSVTDSNNGETTEVLYVDKFSEVRDGKLMKYVYAGNSRVARCDITPDSSFKIQGSSFYLHDHLGSSAFALSDNGGVLEQIVSYPYGSPRLEQKAGIGISDYKFTGKERDVESGLQYFEARYNSGILGRFYRVDPLTSEIKNEWLTEPRKMNFYVYALNNPINLIDQSGLDPSKPDPLDQFIEDFQASSLDISLTYKGYSNERWRAGLKIDGSGNVGKALSTGYSYNFLLGDVGARMNIITGEPSMVGSMFIPQLYGKVGLSLKESGYRISWSPGPSSPVQVGITAPYRMLKWINPVDTAELIGRGIYRGTSTIGKNILDTLSHLNDYTLMNCLTDSSCGFLGIRGNPNFRNPYSR